MTHRSKSPTKPDSPRTRWRSVSRLNLSLRVWDFGSHGPTNHHWARYAPTVTVEIVATTKSPKMPFLRLHTKIIGIVILARIAMPHVSGRAMPSYGGGNQTVSTENVQCCGDLQVAYHERRHNVYPQPINWVFFVQRGTSIQDSHGWFHIRTATTRVQVVFGKNNWVNVSQQFWRQVNQACASRVCARLNTNS